MMLLCFNQICRREVASQDFLVTREQLIHQPCPIFIIQLITIMSGKWHKIVSLSSSSDLSFAKNGDIVMIQRDEACQRTRSIPFATVIFLSRSVEEEFLSKIDFAHLPSILSSCQKLQVSPYLLSCRGSANCTRLIRGVRRALELVG